MKTLLVVLSLLCSQPIQAAVPEWVVTFFENCDVEKAKLTTILEAELKRHKAGIERQSKIIAEREAEEKRQLRASAKLGKQEAARLSQQRAARLKSEQQVKAYHEKEASETEKALKTLRDEMFFPPVELSKTPDFRDMGRISGWKANIVTIGGPRKMVINAQTDKGDTQTRRVYVIEGVSTKELFTDRPLNLNSMAVFMVTDKATIAGSVVPVLEPFDLQKLVEHRAEWLKQRKAKPAAK